MKAGPDLGARLRSAAHCHHRRGDGAPNIGELFDPGGQTFQGINDPCDIDNLNEGTEFRAANCAALLTSLGVDPTTYTDPNSAFISGG